MTPLRRTSSPHRLRSASLSAVLLTGALALISCGSSGTSTTSTGITLTNPYALAFQSARYASEVSVSFTAPCSMKLTSTGTPYTHAAYYLAPVMAGGTVVATTPSGIQLGVTPYSTFPTASTISATFNVCPTRANTTTATGGGGIGVIFSGTALFDAYEATQTVALGDNASYTFTSGGTSYTASFLDTCNQHTTGGAQNSGAAWHYHGNPNCWTSVVDGAANGPSHIIGIALDGFPSTAAATSTATSFPSPRSTPATASPAPHPSSPPAPTTTSSPSTPPATPSPPASLPSTATPAPPARSP